MQWQINSLYPMYRTGIEIEGNLYIIQECFITENMYMPVISMYSRYRFMPLQLSVAEQCFKYPISVCLLLYNDDDFIICDLFVYENFAGIKISRAFFKMPCPTLFYMLQNKLDIIICIKALNMTERWSIDGFDESLLYDCRDI